MSKKEYEWIDGAELLPHTAQKLRVLGSYFDEYLRVRCMIPQQSVFRLAIVDGFAGGGRYSKGEAGSPLVFIETLRQVVADLKVIRAANGMAPLTVRCRLILNDAKPEVADRLQSNVAPVLAAIKDEVKELVIECKILSRPFEEVYPEIKTDLQNGNFRNVLFNLDQCGHKLVMRETIEDILNTFRSSEVFLTFMVQTLLTFLQKTDPDGLLRQLRHLNVKKTDFELLEPLMSKKEWLGTIEQIVFKTFMGTAPFVSPFSIHNPDGWRYWLMHFASSARARQVYNDTLHRNSTRQAHFGRSGLNMLSFNPEEEGSLYLFNLDGRKQALEQLRNDIPSVISGFGDVVRVGDFYHDIYNLTASHSDDIKTALIDSDDIEVLTPNGGERRRAGTITEDDTIRIRNQKSFRSLWKK